MIARPRRTPRLHRLTALAALGLLALSVPAAAQRDRGLFVSAKRGSTDVDQSLGSTFSEALRGDEDTTAYEVGWRFSRFWGVQAGYHDLGTVRGPSGVLCPLIIGVPCPVAIEGDIEAYSVAAFVEIPLGFGFSAFAKGGIASIDTQPQLIFDTGATERLGDISAEEAIYGLGARLKLWGGLRLFGEWESIGGDLETTSFGLTLQF